MRDGAAAEPGLPPLDEAQRQRVDLLRAWESSPLAKANFCALKGIAVAEFDACIALAQRERAERAAARAQRARAVASPAVASPAALADPGAAAKDEAPGTG